ncbi:hypothetical protein P154DRAFT_307417 [Amniculicola lignicola CBS 123094]|uniref:Uncharacterized protein n=1 Tax=Amniculicola lignicola CBS 123094 TaxID=1392246 RepID=A0A6A5W776_9PLEO|nr:hypothetical protein P154DRAFT_307417 [Amniculicola lignicola CBS 123094]
MEALHLLAKIWTMDRTPTIGLLPSSYTSQCNMGFTLALRSGGVLMWRGPVTVFGDYPLHVPRQLIMTLAAYIWIYISYYSLMQPASLSCIAFIGNKSQDSRGRLAVRYGGVVTSSEVHDCRRYTALPQRSSDMLTYAACHFYSCFQQSQSIHRVMLRFSASNRGRLC